MDPQDPERTPDPPARIAVGVIRRAHGVRGEASVEAWTDDPDRFDQLDRVFLVSPDGSEVQLSQVKSWRTHGERLLVAFDGITTPEQVRDLQNWTIEIPELEARTLDEGEYFLHDLEGLSVVDDGTGAPIGSVTQVSSGGGGFLLSVRTPAGHTFEVPFASEICRSIDLATKTLRVALPVGLDDLDSVAAIEDERSIEPENAALEGARTDPDADPVEAPRFRIDLVTIFPRMFDPIREEGIVARGIEKGIIDLRVWDLREFAQDRHRSTDDEAYGGGAGMVMLAEPVFRCVDAIRASGAAGNEPRIIMMSPQGRQMNHAVAGELAATPWLVLLCGRYEGFDERVRLGLGAEELSVGDVVVAGGEIPAMLVVEATCRLIDGVVGDRNSVEADSFYNGLLDYPHYTRPAEIRGLRVPEVLLSGHAERIRRWKKEQALLGTLEKRPELLDRAELDSEARRILEEIRAGKARGT